RQKEFPSKILNIVDWNGRCETPAGIASLRETPQAQLRRGGSRTARGKRVPEVEINVQICTSQKKCRQTRFSSSLSTV
ncbi:UNVERIFIED_CONTAM: hypothetical protein FO527_18160, partial [Bacillus sp. ATCC 13368]